MGKTMANYIAASPSWPRPRRSNWRNRINTAYGLPWGQACRRITTPSPLPMALPRREQALACPRIAGPLIIFIGINGDSANFWVWVRVGHASSGNRPGRRLSGRAPRVPVERTGPLSRKFPGSPEPGLPLFCSTSRPRLIGPGRRANWWEQEASLQGNRPH